jgi:tetratricopeptide (TPR) repeat protein
VGRYADAIREFEAYARIAPREPNPHDSQGEAYLKMGDAEKAVVAYSRALNVDPTFAPSHSLRAWSFAVLGRYDAALAEPVEQTHFRAMILARAGRYRDAARALADGEKQAAASGNPARTGGLRLIAAVLALERGDHAAALRDIPAANTLFEGHTGDLYRIGRVIGHLLSGLAHIQAGRVTDAVKDFQEQERVYKAALDVERSWRRSLEGEIALARGELAQAASAFSGSEPSTRILDPAIIMTSVLLNALPSRDGLARVAIARGDLDGAIRIYRDLLVYGSDKKFIAPFDPRYVLQIARLLEKKGDHKAALDEYQRFLAFWKGADNDLPELAEARRAVARLT